MQQTAQIPAVPIQSPESVAEGTFVHRLFEIIDGRHWDRLPEAFVAEAVYERPGYDPIDGIEALTHFYRDVRIIGSGKHHLEAVVLNETHGACWGRFIGATRDGTPIDERFADCYVFQDGRIKSRRSFFFRPAV